MKVRSSLKSVRNKPGSVVVKRGGTTYVINKRDPRYNARQG
jgi:large subunit ribosomal protein L36